MTKLYLLDVRSDPALKILDEADNYETIYHLMIDGIHKDKDTIVSPNPPTASIVLWEIDKLARSTETKTDRESTDTIEC